MRVSWQGKINTIDSCIICLILKWLKTFLLDKSCNGVNLEFQYDDITFYLKLFVLLYANDTIVYGTYEKDFKII